MILSGQSYPCCDFGQVEEIAPFAAGAAAGSGAAAAEIAQHHGSSITRSVAIGVLTGVAIWYTTRFLAKIHAEGK